MPDVISIETALEVAVPVVAGIAVVRLARSTPWLRAGPARTSLFLFVLLLIASAFLAPGGDLATPMIGEIVSAAVCAAVFVELRRRRAQPI